MLRVIRLAVLLLLLPLGEIYFFRWLFHWPSIDLRPGLPGFVDADLILPGFFSITFLVFLLERVQPIRLQWCRRFAFLNAASVLAFAFASLCFPNSAGGALWWAIFLTMGISAVFVRFPPATLLQNRNWPAIFPCALIASVLVWVKWLYEGAWPFFGVASAESFCALLQQWDSQTRCQWVNPHALALIHPQIKALFGPPCSGIDALFLFIVTTSVYVAIDPKRMNAWQTCALFLASIATAFVLNIFRVSSVFILSLGFSRLLDSQEVGIDVFMAFFHTHAGWVLYSLGTVAYFRMVEWVRHKMSALEFGEIRTGA